MKIIFLGVGEAFDKNLPNNSQIIISKKTNFLLDCGFSIPQQLWKFSEDPEFLDAIYISHQHADHYFGLPAVLLRMWEDGRKKDLTIIFQKKSKDSFQDFMNYAYRDFTEKFKYKINLIESNEGKIIKFNDLKLSFERTVHSEENLAIKINDGKNSFCYGGDGSPEKNSNFYKNSDLLIIETYLYDIEKLGHFSIVEAVDFTERNNAKRLALTHINRELRSNKLFELKIKSDKVKIVIPKPFEFLQLK
ncbi:MAG: MBL fold metallo-hydrolase [Promethearchaeota archaeon]